MYSGLMADQDEFLNLGLDVDSVDVLVFWKDDAVDTNATYALSRDEGIHWTSVDLTRVGEAGRVYYGSHKFTQEQDDYTDDYDTVTNDIALTNTAGVYEALAQKIVLTEEVDIESISLQLSKGTGTPLGSFYIKLVSDNGAGRPSSDSLIISSSAVAVSTITLTTPTLYTFTFNQVETLPAGSYHIVIETDTAYKTGYTSSSNNSIRVWGTTAAGDDTASKEDGGTWSSISGTTKFAYSYDYKQNSYGQISPGAVTPDTLVLLDDDRKLAQKITQSQTQIVNQVAIHTSHNATPTGNVRILIAADDSNNPSATDILAWSDWVAASSVTAGDFTTFDMSTVVLADDTTYWIVLEGDSTYNADAVNGIYWHVDNNNGTGFREYIDPTWWPATSTAAYHLYGRNLNLELRVTGGASGGDIEGFAILYNKAAGITPTGTVNQQRFVFNSVDDNDNEFTLTQFVPNPDLLKVHYVEAGQTFVFGAFSLDGQKVVFPVDTFDNGGVSATVTLVFDQTNGGAYDNSDANALLLAGNHLGSTDTAYDRSIPGRGLFLRRPDGTLREICIDDDDNIVVYSV
jgi:hypothetical protein